MNTASDMLKNCVKCSGNQETECLSFFDVLSKVTPKKCFFFFLFLDYIHDYIHVFNAFQNVHRKKKKKIGF